LTERLLQDVIAAHSAGAQGPPRLGLVIREWLEFGPTRTLEIVAPKLTAIPSPSLHVGRASHCRGPGGVDVLRPSWRIVRTEEDRLNRRLATWFRRVGKTGLAAAMKKNQTTVFSKVITDLVQQRRSQSDIALIESELRTLARDKPEMLESVPGCGGSALVRALRAAASPSGASSGRCDMRRAG
jgi:hypothetical protein